MHFGQIKWISYRRIINSHYGTIWYLIKKNKIKLFFNEKGAGKTTLLACISKNIRNQNL